MLSNTLSNLPDVSTLFKKSPSQTLRRIQTVSLVTRIAVIIGDILVLAVTWVKTAESYKEARRLNLRAPLVTMLFRDGELIWSRSERYDANPPPGTIYFMYVFIVTQPIRKIILDILYSILLVINVFEVIGANVVSFSKLSCCVSEVEDLWFTLHSHLYLRWTSLLLFCKSKHSL